MSIMPVVRNTCTASVLQCSTLYFSVLICKIFRGDRSSYKYFLLFVFPNNLVALFSISSVILLSTSIYFKFKSAMVYTNLSTIRIYNQFVYFALESSDSCSVIVFSRPSLQWWYFSLISFEDKRTTSNHCNVPDIHCSIRSFGIHFGLEYYPYYWSYTDSQLDFHFPVQNVI